MIIISYGAGLGNQMFEYAFYEKVKRVYPNQEIKLDSNYAFKIDHNGIESFNLFGLHPKVAAKEEVINLVRSDKFPILEYEIKENRIIRRIKDMFNLYPKSYIKQTDFATYYEKFFNLDENESYYFYGPFVNERYFYDIRDDVIDIFKFPSITEKHNLEYEKLIKNSNSVSIHIRRGDYITSGSKLIGLNYYKEAINIIEKKADNPTYFVFSDDVSEARKMFGGNDKFIYVEGNNNPLNYRDMQLMSLCKHNITCNSTFSFWGAYLNRDKDKIVISPKEKLTGKTSDPIASKDSILI